MTREHSKNAARKRLLGVYPPLVCLSKAFTGRYPAWLLESYTKQGKNALFLLVIATQNHGNGTGVLAGNHNLIVAQGLGNLGCGRLRSL